MSQFELDNQKLASYLEQHIDDFTGPISSKKFKGGQSNPTYLLESDKKKYVLRSKPPGKLLKGAHAVDREFRVLSALYNTDVPVAKPLHLCEDDDIIGSMFYVMEFVDGRILWDPSLPEIDTTERQKMYLAMSKTMVALHSADIQSNNLSDYGKPGDYFARQTSTWTRQYRASELNTIKAMEQLIEWLPANQPEDDGKVSVVHGDYRLDNLMFDKNKPDIVAVLDWELSTLGHPYADLAYQCMQYHIPRGNGINGLAGLNLSELGIPTEQEYVAMYCQQAGIDAIQNWNYYLSFSLFRLAAICQGVVKRAQDGNASSAQASSYAPLIEPLAQIAVGISNRPS